MAKQPEDNLTMELVLPRGRGRPRKPDALTDAERARAYRARKKAKRKSFLMRQAQYRCPLTGSTWSGHGQMPKWLSVKVANGVDKETFRVHY